MIRNNKLFIAAGAAALSAFLYSATSNAGTVDGTATALVIQPLGIAQTAGMDFGEVAADPLAATTVDLDISGNATSSDGASTSGTAAAGAFTVTGLTDATYVITLPGDTDVTLDSTTTADSMSVTGFISSIGATGSTGTLTGGSDAITVGATLNLDADQAAGTYNGIYTILVEYQ
jgi:hypothetical protein